MTNATGEPVEVEGKQSAATLAEGENPRRVAAHLTLAIWRKLNPDAPICAV